MLRFLKMGFDTDNDILVEALGEKQKTETFKAKKIKGHTLFRKSEA